MLYKSRQAGNRKKTAELCQNKAGQCFKIPATKKSLPSCRIHRKATVELCQDKVGQSFKISAHRSQSDILGLEAKDGCPNTAEDTWGDSTGSHKSLLLFIFGSNCTELSVYSGNNISFWVLWQKLKAGQLQFSLVMIEDKLSTKVWTPQENIDNGVFSINLPNTNELDIVNVMLTW